VCLNKIILPSIPDFQSYSRNKFAELDFQRKIIWCREKEKGRHIVPALSILKPTGD
jgi:hypothetical protein